MCEKPRESFSLGLIKCLMGYPICRDEEVGKTRETWDEVDAFLAGDECFFLGWRDFEGHFFFLV